eukprot:752035-Hanusia_phi.AAC.2
MGELQRDRETERQREGEGSQTRTIREAFSGSREVASKVPRGCGVFCSSFSIAPRASCQNDQRCCEPGHDLVAAGARCSTTVQTLGRAERRLKDFSVDNSIGQQGNTLNTLTCTSATSFSSCARRESCGMEEERLLAPAALLAAIDLITCSLRTTIRSSSLLPAAATCRGISKDWGEPACLTCCRGLLRA